MQLTEKNFSTGINVPRKRFLPVKTTSDLLLVMSDLYTLKAGSLEMSPKRFFPSVPLVKLGNSFKKVKPEFNSVNINYILSTSGYQLQIYFLVLLSQVKDFLHRFANIPDVLELDHLTVSGDVTFGKNVSLKVRTIASAALSSIFPLLLNCHTEILTKYLTHRFATRQTCEETILLHSTVKI